MIERMHGLHLMADLRGVDAALPVMLDTAALRALCLHAVRAAGLHAVGESFHRFPPPGGITGVVLLAESHVAIHTWPELQGVTLDVYVCHARADNSAAAQAIQAALEAAFAPTTVLRHRLQRGVSNPDAADTTGGADPGP